MNTTKENILQVSLKLFAKYGYNAVSVSQISGELGITKGALYRHYKNKRDIFEHILARMEEYDAKGAEDYNLPEGTLEDMAEKYCETSLEQIIQYTKSQFKYWTTDNFASSFRKMLTLEQFQNEEMKKLYQQYLVSGPLGYTTDLFSSLNYTNPKLKALEFYAPMFFLYSLYDETEDIASVYLILENHLNKLYSEFIGEKNEA